MTDPLQTGQRWSDMVRGLFFNERFLVDLTDQRIDRFGRFLDRVRRMMVLTILFTDFTSDLTLFLPKDGPAPSSPGIYFRPPIVGPETGFIPTPCSKQVYHESLG